MSREKMGFLSNFGHLSNKFGDKISKSGWSCSALMYWLNNGIRDYFLPLAVSENN